MEFPVLNLVVREQHPQKFRENAVAVFKKQVTVRSGRSDDDIAAFLRFRAEAAVQHVVDVFIVCGPPPSAMIAG